MAQKVNELKGKTKEQIESFIVSDMKNLGSMSFDIHISPQAKEIISNMAGAFPYEHFKVWFIKNKMVVNGGHLHEYLSQNDGFSQGIKEMVN